MSAGLGVTVLSVATPGVALAAPDIDVYPAVAQRGQSVSVRVNCDPSVTSAVLQVGMGPNGDLPMVADGAKPGMFFADFAVPDSWSYGRHAIQVKCGDGQYGIGHLTVAPRGGPDTGAGATAAGADMGVVAVGGSIVALAALGTLLVLRRRRAGAPDA